jgi:putative PIN family toxin of toxin-antitoxin system
LDANVYVSAIIRPEGPPGRMMERFLCDSAFAIVLSPTIVEETLRALAYTKVRKYIRRTVDPELWFEDIVLLAELAAGDYAMSGASTHPDDDKYLGAALEGRATLVVTGDPDLLALGAYEGIRIVSPRVFLGLVGG